jgi:hypothetical protein
MAVVRGWKGYGSSEGVDHYCREHFAAVEPVVRDLLASFDDRVTHYTVVLSKPAGIITLNR